MIFQAMLFGESVSSKKTIFKLFHRNCFPFAHSKTNLKLNRNEKEAKQWQEQQASCDGCLQ